MVLPWGAHATHKPETGWEPGAPERPKLGVKVVITTLLAGLVLLGVYQLIESDWLVLGEI